MPLKQYNKKRNFNITNEPKGEIKKAHKKLFVVQKHAASRLHYDFRLELNGVLLSWAVPKGPCLDPSVKRLAVHVEDHPVEYGHFEGAIPKGQYGGGTVMLWDVGTWQSEDADPVKAYKKGHLRFILHAKKLKGAYSLVRIKSDENAWLLIKADDKYAKPLADYDITEKKNKSVISHLSIESLTKKLAKNNGNTVIRQAKKPFNKHQEVNLAESTFPKKMRPQLATLVSEATDSSDWLHELKFDGYRIIAFKNGKNVTLFSRNHNDWTAEFKSIAVAVKKLPPLNLVLDGEVVVLDKNNKSNFQLLQNSIKQNIHAKYIYYVFDIIYYDKYNLESLPLLQRKEILKNIINKNEKKNLRYSPYTIGSGKNIFKQACKMDMEGIVSKEIHSTYEQRRTTSWQKVKCIKRQEFVIGGYTKPKGSRGYFGSLLLGVYNKNKELVYCGNVGTGFTQASLKQVYDALQKNNSANNPFNSRPPGVSHIKWVEPILLCEVEFTEWTSDEILRHPSFKGMRSDKSPKTIKKEKAMKVKANKVNFLTNPDKILYPEDKITKLDLAMYYNDIQKWILRYLINRPLTLVRCPDNYKSCFYQKHLAKSVPKAVATVSIKEKTKTDKYLYIKDITGLLSLVQLGALEFHPWGSHVKRVEYPDMITFDLDPAPGVPWDKVAQAARLLKKELNKLNLKSFVKTTGGKGLHVVVPILPEYKWDRVSAFCHALVEHVVNKHPDDYIGTASKLKRRGKIFIDYLRNKRGATAIAAYSTRARLGAPVSTPLGWNELSKSLENISYTIFSLPKRLKKLKKDPWQDFFTIKQSLNLD